MIFERLAALLAEQFVIKKDFITEDTAFAEDLGADSLDIVELAMAIEEEFDITEMNEEDLPALLTVGDVVRYIANLVD